MEFIEPNGLGAPPPFGLLDTASEPGEVATDATESTGHVEDPDAIMVEHDEPGDVAFSVLGLAGSLDVDAGGALEEPDRDAEWLAEGETPASGR